MLQSIDMNLVTAKIVEILEKNGDWMDRGQIQAEFGRTLGTPEYAPLVHLDNVEIRQVKVGLVKTKYEYRAK